MGTHKRVSKLRKGDEFKRHGAPWTITSDPVRTGPDNLYEFHIKNPEGARDKVWYRGVIQVEMVKEAPMEPMSETQEKIRAGIDRDEYPELDDRIRVGDLVVAQRVITVDGYIQESIDAGEEADVVGFWLGPGRVEMALVIFDHMDPIWVPASILEDCS